jgi:hypothetical protein
VVTKRAKTEIYMKCCWLGTAFTVKGRLLTELAAQSDRATPSQLTVD